MAVTINTNPSGTPSVHDALWHVATSDNSGTTDFKYVFDIVINGDRKLRVKQFPEPSNGKGYFDAGPTVRNYMTYEWFEPINSSAYVAEPGFSGEAAIIYALQVGEEVSGLTTTNMASGQVTGYCWAPPLLKRRIVSLSDKLNKWLTNRRLTMEIGECTADQAQNSSENLFIGFYTDAVSVNLKVETYLFSNVMDNSVSGSVHVPSSGFLQMNIGQTALYNELNITIDERIRFYDVWFNSYEKVRVYTKCNPKYQCYPVHFLNRWGMWDTVRFDLASRLSMDVDRKGFSQKDYRFNGNSVDYISTANRYYEGRIDHSNKSRWNFKLTADAMSDQDFEWIAELYTSPQRLLEIDGYFYPVTVKQSNYDYKKFVNDRLKPLEVEFELNTERYTQLR